MTSREPTTAVVGPCACGGYGVLLDERYGRCHESIEESTRRVAAHRLRIVRDRHGFPWRAIGEAVLLGLIVAAVFTLVLAVFLVMAGGGR